MRLHILSDIHLEARPQPKLRLGKPAAASAFTPSITDADVVVLAGDIHSKGRGVAWAKETFPSGQVVYVCGNHEFWGGNVHRTLAKMKAEAAGSNVHVLEKDALVIEGVRFLGTTGWTDFLGTGNMPVAMWDAQQAMNDYKRIRHREAYMRWRPQDAQAHAAQNKHWLREQLDAPFEGKTVVVTHHPLCMLSVRAEDPRHPHLEASYGNRWEELFGGRAELAIHGHTHHAMDYDVYGTRVLSNPVGHAFEETGYNPWLVVDL